MPGKQSAGILAFRRGAAGTLEVLLVHPGGPFWKNKDAQAWSIPKGELDEREDRLAAARREFAEELGFEVDGNFLALTPVRQRGGKTVHAFAVEADFDTARVKSNTFSMEWPPKSGKLQDFPEIDRAEWFPLSAALQKINSAQISLLRELGERVAQT
jgi:predicted NUDIX family NTP pyrophosphohydrolase